MALRDCINNDEIRTLQKAFEETGDWEKTKKYLPGVDPKALDAGFKDFIVSGGKKKAAPPAKPDPLK